MNMAERLRAEADEYARWAPTSWNQSGTEGMLKHAQLLRAAADEVHALSRARDVAIKHILNRGDATGALAALTMQRDTPAMFDLAKFEGE